MWLFEYGLHSCPRWTIVLVPFPLHDGVELDRSNLQWRSESALEFDHSFEFRYADIGATAIDKTGNPLPEETLDVCEEADAILFGAIGHPKYDNDPNAKTVRLRDRLNEADTERRKSEEEALARERAAEIRREERLKKIAYMNDMPDNTPAGTGMYSVLVAHR